MPTLTIGITIQDIAIIILKRMDTSLKIALEHISEEITLDGWVKLHALVVTKLVMWERISQQGPRHQNLNLKKAKQKLKILEMRWTRHGKRSIQKMNQMEKGSLFPMGQVVTLHQTKKKGRYVGLIPTSHIIH